MRFRHTRAAAGLHVIGLHLEHTKHAVIASPFGRKTARAAASVKRAGLRGTAHATQSSDWLEHHLPSAWGRSFHKLRALDPISNCAFVCQRIKNDPVFSATYGTFSVIGSNASIPMLMAAGVSGGLATVARFALASVDVLALTLRAHAQRKDRSQGFLKTAGTLFRESKAFVKKSRRENRAYIADHWPPNMAPLAH